MHELQYHLTVHNPYRPLEGLLIDIKVINSLPLTSQCLEATIYQTILVKNVRVFVFILEFMYHECIYKYCLFV